MILKAAADDEDDSICSMFLKKLPRKNTHKIYTYIKKAGLLKKNNTFPISSTLKIRKSP